MSNIKHSYVYLLLIIALLTVSAFTKVEASTIPTNGSVDNGKIQYDFNFDMDIGEATIAISNVGTTPITDFNLDIAELISYEADPDVWYFIQNSGTVNFRITGGELGYGSEFLIDYIFNKDLAELTFGSIDYRGIGGLGTLDGIVTLKQVPEPTTFTLIILGSSIFLRRRL